MAVFVHSKAFFHFADGLTTHSEYVEKSWLTKETVEVVVDMVLCNHLLGLARDALLGAGLTPSGDRINIFPVDHLTEIYVNSKHKQVDLPKCIENFRNLHRYRSGIN
jgi:hypothetical protein